MPCIYSLLRLIFFCLFLTWLYAGCSQKIVVKEPEALIINNHGGRAIHSLVVKPCTKPYEEFEEMAKDIKPGTTTFIRLYPGCFDADALDENGELMATQYKFRLPPQLRWDVH